jgi:hypothetical protein
VLQVLVDADNLHRARLTALLQALPTDAVVIAAGSVAALGKVEWPDATVQLARSGWQRADLELAAAYTPDSGPLIVASGDGDFSHLTRRIRCTTASRPCATGSERVKISRAGGRSSRLSPFRCLSGALMSATTTRGDS